ncbi:5-oxoprolinase subunit PxpB [Ureibacillus sp. FSL K6-8385]|uniref:5-oxoprolinase subunit PxpB n=1 Tax=Ureibacillus terrenus TaxID=118246 RepID=A0A540V6C7_9BACL|nr:5-oxoprolinase subunit PxpB [Ureibacillus terrenus]TQE92306.1 5-oxoprolinase subunit PxpB [Ureibacillus terrenus]
MAVQFKPLGDQAVLVYFGNIISEEVHNSIKKFMYTLEKNWVDGLVEMVPGYTNVCVYYDVMKVAGWEMEGHSPYEKIVCYLRALLHEETEMPVENSRIIEIPVCYGGIYGPDLEEIARYHHLSEQQVIQIHSGKEYLVYMLGFAPGFAFLGGLDERIATPRKDTPRLKIPPGSVGIAGRQTGIYPLETPGGWQIIGRTPLQLFLPDQNPPALLRTGDRIRFVPITEKEFRELAGEA